MAVIQVTGRPEELAKPAWKSHIFTTSVSILARSQKESLWYPGAALVRPINSPSLLGVCPSGKQRFVTAQVVVTGQCAVSVAQFGSSPRVVDRIMFATTWSIGPESAASDVR
jgi:hypothetical protein